MEELRIYFSKVKILFLMVLLTVFVGALVWLFSIADTIELSLFWLVSFGSYSSIVLRLLSGAAIFFFSLGFLLLCKRLFAGKPAFVLNEDGLLNNIHGATSFADDQVKVIPWSAMTSISYDRGGDGRQELIVLEVASASRFKVRQKGAWGILHRLLMAGTPKAEQCVILQAAGLKGYSAKKFTSVLERYWQEYRAL